MKATGDNYVEIGFYKDRKTMGSTKLYRLHAGENKLSIPVAAEPYKVVVDPRLLLIDRKLEDNEVKLGKEKRK